VEVVLPDKELISYKEALIFGFMGLLKELNQNNCLSSVTGALRDCCAGKVYLP
jgi:anhydro-N-acetylmuramic acid kinase